MSTEKKAPANCGKCGLCLSVCPVYRVLKEEQASPRARLQLIKAFENQTLTASPLLKEIISKCLMCGACAVTCPSGINHYEKFMEMRQKMVAELGEDPAIKALIHLLSKEFMLRAGTGLAAVGQRITPEFLAKKYKVGNIPLSRLPRLNARPFRGSRPSVIPCPPVRGRVAYFTGCATSYMFEDTGTDTVRLLTGLGYEVIIPKGQTCCAIPMLFHGAGTRAAKSIRTNIRTLAEIDCDHIIVDCTTCGAALKDEYPAFMEKALAQQGKKGGPKDALALLEQAKAISGKVKDILSFVADPDTGLRMPPAQDSPGKTLRAVYHAPCHSRNSFGTHSTVQTLLAALPGIDYRPLASEADCCGGGGTFFYEHPDLARKMMAPKVSAVREAKAELWLTDCPVCRINLEGALAPEDRIRVCHPVSVIPVPNRGNAEKAAGEAAGQTPRKETP